MSASPSPPEPPPRTLALTLDGQPVRAREGDTLLETCRALGKDIPTACFAENLLPVNVCRLCVVEVEGARTLVPACSRRVEPGMVVQTDSPRVRAARKMVLELLASSVDLSTAPALLGYARRYGADPARFGPRAATAAQPLKEDNALFVRDYGKCILCYKCVQACGDDAQNTFAITVAGRGFHAGISTEHAVTLPDSACVFCGNCVGVCPTGALMPVPEHRLRAAGSYDESRQTRVDTVCSYCGVGCALTLHVQDNRIFKVSSPASSSVTGGHLCIKGRFGFEFVHAGRPAP